MDMGLDHCINCAFHVLCSNMLPDDLLCVM